MRPLVLSHTTLSHTLLHTAPVDDGPGLKEAQLAPEALAFSFQVQQRRLTRDDAVDCDGSRWARGVGGRVRGLRRSWSRWAATQRVAQTRGREARSHGFEAGVLNHFCGVMFLLCRVQIQMLKCVLDVIVIIMIVTVYRSRVKMPNLSSSWRINQILKEWTSANDKKIEAQPFVYSYRGLLNEW